VSTSAPLDTRRQDGEHRRQLDVVVHLGAALLVIGVGTLAGPPGLIAAIEIFAIVVLAACLLGITALLSERQPHGSPTAKQAAWTRHVQVVRK
jgi:hypothetical protein